MVQTEQDLKPEFRLKVAEWEVRKAMIGATKPEPKRVEDTEIDKIKKLMPGETLGIKREANAQVIYLARWIFRQGATHLNFFKLRFGKVADFKLLFLHGGRH